jgi:hypothetical protein
MEQRTGRLPAILKAATASRRNFESFPHLNFDSIGGVGNLSVQPVTALMRFSDRS